ncbi:glycosyltransferase family 4 protein [Gordonia alkanivorans]|uniref:glycosyltransferase family 4 protein n=1 Tax=Gordonia alkanivorans TaxID=84096 RepID=UPI0024B6A818|nr:glycosyltransferase family 4 protein [Gordonia alkanivorans]MDJ0029635.1 glycosyltransferase family 4 protein [Gordonia alkanivorans]
MRPTAAVQDPGPWGLKRGFVINLKRVKSYIFKRRAGRRGVALLSLNYSPEPTGIAPYSADLAAYLRSTGGHDVHVIAAHPHYPDWKIAEGYGQWTLCREEEGVEVRRLRHYVPASPRNLQRLLAELTFAVRSVLVSWKRAKVVITVSPSLLGSAAVVLKSRITCRPVIVWVQDLYGTGLEERGDTGFVAGFLAKAVRRLESATLRGADRVVTIHDRFKHRILEDFNIDPSKVDVVRNWSHISAPTTADTTEIRSAHGWSNRFVVLHTGAQGKKQGLAEFAKIAIEISERIPDVRWVFIGTGTERQRIEEAIGSADCVEVWDPLPDHEFVRILEAADAFLVCEAPGVAEAAVPSKLTTYFSAARPVIGVLTKGGITWSELELSGGGIPVSHDGVEVLNVVRAIKNDPELARSLATRGESFSATNLGKDQSLRGMSQSITKVLAGEDL